MSRSLHQQFVAALCLVVGGAPSALALPRKLRARLIPPSLYQRSIASREETLQAARHSAMIYEHKELIKSPEYKKFKKKLRSVNGGKFEKPLTPVETKLGTVVAIKKSRLTNRLTVIFQGSKDPTTTLGRKNWFITNLRQWKAPLRAPSHGWWRAVPLTPMGNRVGMHHGYLRTYECEGLEERLFEKIDKELKKDKKCELFVTGHSLGGALATIFGARYALVHSNHKIKVITFGCPRVGNRNFRELTECLPNLSITRVVHDNDLIPRWPTFGFRHVGHTVLLPHVDDAEVTPKINPWHNDGPGRSGEWNYLKLIPRLGKSIADHSMNEYVHALEKVPQSDWLGLGPVVGPAEGKDEYDDVGCVDDFGEGAAQTRLRPVPVFLAGVMAGTVVASSRGAATAAAALVAHHKRADRHTDDRAGSPRPRRRGRGRGAA